MMYSRSPFLNSYWLVGLAAFAANQLVHTIVVFALGGSEYFSCNFDCGWYVSIVDSGYMLEPMAHRGHNAANWAFFPLFPMLSAFTQLLTDLSTPLAVVLTAKALWLPAIWAFLALQSRYRPEIPYWVAAAVIALNPASIYGNTGYTEPLYILLSCLTLLSLLNDKPVMAGLFGALVTATRSVGLGIGLAYFVYALQSVITRSGANGGKLLFGGMLIPLGLAIYMTFLHFHVGDAFAFSHVQIAWGRQIDNPFTQLLRGLLGNAYQKTMAGCAIMSLLCALYLAWRRDLGFALYLAFVTLVPLATGVASMARFVILQPPLLLVIGTILTWFRWRLVPLALLMLGYVLMTFSWVEGYFFVI